MESLPDVLLLEVMQHLSPVEACAQLGAASKRFHRLSTSDELWRAYCKQEGLEGAPESGVKAFFLGPHAAEPDGGYKSGSLTGESKASISRRLGFQPNVEDDPSKVTQSWCAKLYRGGQWHSISIWDWKGSAEWGDYSTYGPEWVFEELGFYD